MMRGFRKLRATPDGLDLIGQVKDALSRAPFARRVPRFSRWQFGAAHAHGEWAVRQFLTVHVAGLSLHKSLLLAIGTPGGKVWHPLPGPWRAVVEASGIPVSHAASRVLWWGFIAGSYLYGCRQAAVTLFRAILGAASSKPLTGTAYFVGLTKETLPAPGLDGRSFDVITWYSRWDGCLADVTGYTHHLAGQSVPDVDGRSVRGALEPVPLPAAPFSIATFAVWSLGAAAAAAVDLVLGKWWHALLLSQSTVAARARVEPGSLAADYLFHNSGWILRPLWTYEAAAQGSRILFYFYSTNAEAFKTPARYPLQPHTWNVTNWPHYLVWDEPQAAFIRRNVVAPAVVDIVGPIWFQSSDRPLPQIEPDSVAVFDVQPVRDFVYQVHVASKMYYTPELSSHFMRDVEATLSDSGRTIVFKRKRSTVGHFIQGRYRRMVARMAARPGVLTVAPEVPAWRVIDACAAVISMPFTSTALIGRHMGKPSIYYVPDYSPNDPVQADDRAAHGIPIVAGREALRCWLAALPAQTATQKTS